MEAYAVIETGGKQYLVHSGTTVDVERMASAAGEKVELQRVLAVSDGNRLRVGTPSVDGARVNCTVVEHKRGRKVVSFKRRRRKGYSRKIGHRQELTVLKVDSIG
jgi:large subunit ribosomal protein L21